MATGFLQVRITTQMILPLKNVEIFIIESNSTLFLEEKTVITNADGLTPIISLPTVPKDISLNEKSTNLPCKMYNIIVNADNYIQAEAIGVQVFEGELTLQEIDMLARPLDYGSNFELTTVREEPPKLYRPEGYDKVGTNRVLQRVVIPQNITVHLGAPNSSAQNVIVPFRTYLKSVAASEIYPTWPEQALRANIYAQISFVLNRIFTEWYPSRGYNFNITNSPSYDQKYVHNGSTFSRTDKIVDEIFNEYIVKEGRIDPFFAEYCDGKIVTCKGMSQWGSKYDADNGMSALSILRKYYGNNISIKESDNITSIPVSYSGTPLKEGSVGEDVRTIQAQLNRIADDYPSITKVRANGIFGADMTSAVKRFQTIFKLNADGVVGKQTWYKISYIYVSVKRLAQLTSEGLSIDDGSYPGYAVKRGDRGLQVQIIQFYLNQTAVYVNSILPVTIDGIFGEKTEKSVKLFQKYFNIAQDGIVGEVTWIKMYDIYQGIKTGVTVPPATPPEQDVYPGTPLRVGSTGINVSKIQNWLNGVGKTYTSIPFINVDAKYGPMTRTAVIAFQKQFGLSQDGVVGAKTWNMLYGQWQNLAAQGKV